MKKMKSIFCTVLSVLMGIATISSCSHKEAVESEEEVIATESLDTLNIEPETAAVLDIEVSEEMDTVVENVIIPLNPEVEK